MNRAITNMKIQTVMKNYIEEKFLEFDDFTLFFEEIHQNINSK